MSAFTDRLIGPFRMAVRAATARVDFYALYSAVVNSDNGDETLDFTPEDSRLPSQSRIPKMYGLPGVKSTIASGSKILFGFANGDPSKPYVAMYDGTSASKVSLQASTVNLSGDSPADAVALAAKVNARCGAIETVLKTWTVVPSDGGLALKTFALAQLAAPASTASTKVKAD